MNGGENQALSKVPAVTLVFWMIKIAATTLGETGGDAVSMSMDLGYLVGTVIFAAIFAVAVFAQIVARRFNPWLYWGTIVATTTVGTTLADYVTRSLGIGYAGGTSLLLVLLIASLFVWHRALGSISVDTVSTPQAEIHYWLTIMFSQTLGTALGDWSCRYGRSWLCGRRDHLQRAAGTGCRRVFLDGNIPHHTLLDRIHPDQAAWCRGRRFPGQAH